MAFADTYTSTTRKVGDFTRFGFDAFVGGRRLVRRWVIFLRQCEFIGLTSLGINLVAATFMGGVLAFQLYFAFKRFGAEALLGTSIGVSLFRELGPVMAAIMVTGRSGAAMAAEIATMRITEQIDALEIMAVNPIEYLVTPRVYAGMFMMPIVAIFFSCVACLAGAGVACGILDLPWATYWTRLIYSVDIIEIFHCVFKGAVFGVILTSVGCYMGFSASGGARSVGQAARMTVVVSFLMILISDYFMTSMLPDGDTRLSLLK